MSRLWWIKFRNDPPLVEPQNVYTLTGRDSGGVVFVVGPGPSLGRFPIERLARFTSIGLNGVAEIVPTTFWIFQEGFFAKHYRTLYQSDRIRRVVTTKERYFLQHLLPATHELFLYSSLHLKVPRVEKPTPFFWASPETGYLPGRSTIAANALSLAVLLGARLIVLVGIDFAMPAGEYYAPGVKINRGPRLQRRALHAGLAWIQWAAKKGVWVGPRIISTSPWLHVSGIRQVSVEQALAEAEEVLR